MNLGLRTTLHELIESGADDNLALERLVDEYARFHLVLVVVGGCFLLAFGVLGASCWRRYRNSPKRSGRRPGFERSVYIGFALASATMVLLLGLLVAANLSNVANSRDGFAGSVDVIATPRPGTQAERVQDGFEEWLRSGDREPPAVVTERLDDRLRWQRPKAVASAVLLVALVWISSRLWRHLIRAARARGSEGRWNRSDIVRCTVGIAVGAICVGLVAMVLGNTQGAVAPMSLTLVFG